MSVDGAEEAAKVTLGVQRPNKKWMSNDMGQFVARRSSVAGMSTSR